MADSGKQSPLGVNVLGSLLNNQGFRINPIAQSYMGSSKTNDSYTFGSIVQDTVLRLLTLSINDGYNRGPGDSNTTLSDTTYNNLISIGSDTIPALGNSKPPTYVVEDQAGVWTTVAQSYGLEQTGSPVLPGPANSGYPVTGVTDSGQQATWLPYDTTNPNQSITQWGYVRLHALQAWNEFNWNGTSVDLATPEYKEFLNSYLTASGWVQSTNQAILAVNDSEQFMQGIYSNMTDLITADISGVSLSTTLFGADLINLGKALDLRSISTFGLPSNLLRTLGKNNAITPDLNLALLAAGLTKNDLSSIINTTNALVSVQTEQKIYGAFLIITGANLKNILAPLLVNPVTINNMTTLADMLDVSKLFPSSYLSLTVPIYNDQLGLPTNSKTYYPIYSESNSINEAITTDAVNQIIGVQIPSGQPITTQNATPAKNFKALPLGFGSYLRDILPPAQATAAGAFSYAMRQINSIETCDIQKFSRVVASLEGVTDLPLTSGTDKPVNQDTKDLAQNVMAQGSGPYNTFTMSDLFGSMSGLPYNWKTIKNTIDQLATNQLFSIYENLFLAVTWEGATVEVETETRVVGGVTEYRVASFTITNPGGGYGRGDAPDPIITASNGGSGTGVVGRDDATAGSNGTGEFGRIIETTVVDPGNWVTTPPTATIEFPPTTVPGTNTVTGTTGWQEPMNTVVQDYIDDANEEITSIQNRSASGTRPCANLNIEWNQLGNGLKREQRTRYSALIPVTVPKDHFLGTYPATQITFVDSMSDFAQDTRPHMNAQTIEAISNTDEVSGQSIIGLQRQERNQLRLRRVGIQLDNNLSDALSATDIKTVTTNGTFPGIKDGIPSASGLEWTPPAWVPDAVPAGIYVPPTDSGFDYSTIAGQTGFFPILGPLTPGSNNPIINGDTPPFLVGSNVPSGPPVIPETDPTIPLAITVPSDSNPNNLPPELDLKFTSTTLLPSVPDIRDAIEQVIKCNCDCWIE